MHWSSPTERDQGKIPRVSSAFGRDGPQGAHHGRIRYLRDAIGRGQDFHIERLSDLLLNRGPGGLAVNGQSCPGDSVRIHIAKHHIGISHRRLGSAPAITGRTGVRTRTLGADP